MHTTSQKIWGQGNGAFGGVHHWNDVEREEQLLYSQTSEIPSNVLVVFIELRAFDVLDAHGLSFD
jgi:hypothetical protein